MKANELRTLAGALAGSLLAGYAACPAIAQSNDAIPASILTPGAVETGLGKGWFAILRLYVYGPLEPFFTKEWRPSEIELVK